MGEGVSMTTLVCYGPCVTQYRAIPSNFFLKGPLQIINVIVGFLKNHHCILKKNQAESE